MGRELGVRAQCYITKMEAYRARASEGAGRGAIDVRPGGVSRAASERHGGATTPRGGPAARAARVGRHARCGMRQRRARRAGPR